MLLFQHRQPCATKLSRVEVLLFQHRYGDSYKAKCCLNTDTLTATKLCGRVLLFQHKYADSHKTKLCGRVVGGEHNCASVKPIRSSSTKSLGNLLFSYVYWKETVSGGGRKGRW